MSFVTTWMDPKGNCFMQNKSDRERHDFTSMWIFKKIKQKQTHRKIELMVAIREKVGGNDKEECSQ